jgi:hypothetical protein
LYAIHDALDGTTVMIEKWSSVEELDERGSGEAVRAQTAALENPPQQRPFLRTKPRTQLQTAARPFIRELVRNNKVSLEDQLRATAVPDRANESPAVSVRHQD